MEDVNSSILTNLGQLFARFAKILSIALVVIIAAGLFAPVIKTHADEDLGVEVTANVEQVVSVTLTSAELEFNISPSSDGTFMKKSVVTTVKTNSTAGYDLFMSSEDNESDLVNANTDVKIASGFDGTKTELTMANNTWGFSLDSTNFSAIPLRNAQATIRSASVMPTTDVERNTTVSFGVKVDKTLPAGKYSKTVVFSAIAREPRMTIFDIEYMQQMTPTICQNTTTPDRYTAATTDVNTIDTTKIPVKTLTDRRDGKTYSIAKYADGNCWMGQNLAFELNTETALTPASTDLHTKTSWRPENSTQITNGAWPSNIVNAGTRSYIGTYGGYYNWSAATAGHSAEAVSTIVEDSICPKGWRLPVRSGDGSFAKLFGDTYSFVSIDDFFSGPMALAKSGYFPFGSGHVDGYEGWTDSGGISYPNGGQTWLWTAATSDDSTTNAIAIYAGVSGDKWPGLDSARSTIKAHGLAIRCVAR